jgi:hypothetical protein
LPALPGPVDVLQVQPERELVDGEADANPEDRGRRVERGPRRGLRYQDDAGADDDQDAEDLVVDVVAAERDVAEPGPASAARSDHPGHHPGDEESDQDAQEQPHHGLQ